MTRRSRATFGRKTIAFTTSSGHWLAPTRTFRCGTSLKRNGLGRGAGAVGARGGTCPGPEGTPLEGRCLRGDMETASDLELGAGLCGRKQAPRTEGTVFKVK